MVLLRKGDKENWRLGDFAKELEDWRIGRNGRLEGEVVKLRMRFETRRKRDFANERLCELL